MQTLQTYLPLSGEVTVTGGDTEDERVELREVVRREDGVVGLRGCVELVEDVLGEGLCDPVGQGSTVRTN